MIEDKEFMEHCVDNNFAFLKSIPNSVQYWVSKKKDLFAMIRQLGKPTMFLTMSANELQWPQLLNELHGVRTGDAAPVDDPVQKFSATYRADLVNEDSVTCCLHFWRKISVIMQILSG